MRVGVHVCLCLCSYCADAAQVKLLLKIELSTTLFFIATEICCSINYILEMCVNDKMFNVASCRTMSAILCGDSGK